MKLIKVNKERIKDEDLLLAARRLSNGGLVVFPTETVYGLGANAEDEKAVSEVYRIKNRPTNKPLSLHIADLEIFYTRLRTFVDKNVQKLINKFWPGPLTLIVETEKGKEGFRMPDNVIARQLIELSGVPVVAPSANISGKVPPQSYSEISEEIRTRVDIIIDGGKANIGIESTVLDVTTTPYKILREGALKKEEIKEVAYNEEY